MHKEIAKGYVKLFSAENLTGIGKIFADDKAYKW